ncbi:24800_t:CDS:2, partial [Gigaspora rosea]
VISRIAAFKVYSLQYMEVQQTDPKSTTHQCYFNIFSEEEISCKGVLRAISLLTPISEEKYQELDGKYLCQTLYNYELYKVLELDSTAKICHRCIKYMDSDLDYITNTQATKWSSQDKNIIQKAIQCIKPFQNL